MDWLLLILAGFAEIAFATSLKLSEQFSKVVPTVSFIIFLMLSFYLMTKAMNTIPIGTVYAVWTGIGAAGTAIIGIYFFNEPLSVLRVLFISLLLVSILGLKICS